jgi:Reverse transcriptase (RNA-dependent DNA polymerase)
VHCKIAIYADDTALTSSIKNYDLEKLVKIMDSGLKEIESHFASWKIKLNSAKTESILFRKLTKMQKKMDLTRIKINDEKFEWKNSVKYLGVVLDSKLTFKANLAENHLKARKAMATLYCLLKKNSTLRLREKITLYRSYIRPIMTYACPEFTLISEQEFHRFMQKPESRRSNLSLANLPKAFTNAAHIPITNLCQDWATTLDSQISIARSIDFPGQLDFSSV